MAQRTVHGYLRSVRQLADFCKSSPGKISETQLREWLLYLKIEKQFAYGSLRVAFGGIKFFYTRTCRRNWRTLAETKLQNIKSLPEVITRQQVRQIIDACSTERMATFFWTVYSLGLRLDEALNLHVGDIRIEQVDNDGVTYRVKPSGRSHWVMRHANGHSFVAAFALRRFATTWKVCRNIVRGAVSFRRHRADEMRKELV